MTMDKVALLKSPDRGKRVIEVTVVDVNSPKTAAGAVVMHATRRDLSNLLKELAHVGLAQVIVDVADPEAVGRLISWPSSTTVLHSIAPLSSVRPVVVIC